VSEAKKKADEMLGSAQNTSEERILEAETMKKNSIKEQLKGEKESAQKTFAAESEAIDKEVSNLKTVAQQNEDMAVKKVVSAFLHLFSKK